MSGVDNVMLFADVFADTSQIESDVLYPSETRSTIVYFVAPTGVGVSTVPQVQDPDGTWHDIAGTLATADGDCDAIPLPFNTGPLRILITPSAGSGSATCWARAYGS